MARSGAGSSTEPWRPAGPDPRNALAPIERALREHMESSLDGSLNMVTDDGGEQELPVMLFFRTGRDLLPADQAALALCRGRVINVGAGTGALAHPLQAAGHEGTTL